MQLGLIQRGQQAVDNVAHFSGELSGAVARNGVGVLPGPRHLNARTNIELLHRQSVGPLVEAAHLCVDGVSPLDELSAELTAVELFSRSPTGSAIGARSPARTAQPG